MSTIILKAHKICVQLKYCDFLLNFLAILRRFQNSVKNRIFDQKKFSTSQFLDFSMNFFMRCSPIGYYRSCIRKFKCFFFTIQCQNTLFFDFFRKKTDDCKFNLLAQKKSCIILFTYSNIFLRRIECYFYFLNSFRKKVIFMENSKYHNYFVNLRIKKKMRILSYKLICKILCSLRLPTWPCYWWMQFIFQFLLLYREIDHNIYLQSIFILIFN